MRIEITDHADVDRAESLVSWLRRPRVDRVVVAVPELDFAERERSAKAIRHLFNDCGCTWAVLTLLAAVAAVVAASPSGRAVIAVAVLGCMAATVAGKLLGLAWSRRRLLARLRALRSAM